MHTAVTYRSNGKVLISGEYLVLDGAMALALPVKPGQSLFAERREGDPAITWESKIKGQPWFRASFLLPGLAIQSTSDKGIALRLQSLLLAAASFSPGFPGEQGHWHVVTDLDFDLTWGLGSSSTLISNIAYWFNIDPFALFWKYTSGSGYDVACARSKRAILYQVTGQAPVYREVDFSPAFRDKLFFIHLGRKQDSASGIRHYRASVPVTDGQIERISVLSDLLYRTDDLEEFEQLLREHESIISQVIGILPVGHTRFSDFTGAIKSLGAWGGDFILATWPNTRQELEAYFNRKGLQTIIPFDEMIL